jgi:transcriptional regulator with XRE-family HTH domain
MNKRTKLIAARLSKGWSQEALAEKVGVARNTVSAWERGIADPYPVHMQRLCNVFALSTEDLDLLPGGKDVASHSAPLQDSSSHSSPAQDIMRMQDASSELGGNHVYMILRRQFLQQIFRMTGNAFSLSALTQLVEMHPHQIGDSNNHEFLAQCEANIAACWRLMRGNEILVTQVVLLNWLPVLDALIKDSSRNLKKFTHLAAQGYIIAGLVAVLQRNYAGAEWSCKQAVEYSYLAGDHSLNVAALKHLATKYHSAKYHLLTLQTYQEALPLIDQASPLLRSRIYLGLALSFAKCRQEQEANYYLGLAQDTFPEHPESDPSFLYADCGLSSLNHYGGLIALEFNQPKKAWEIFAGVEKLKSKTAIPERTIIEIINCQAEAAIARKELELATDQVQAGIAGALRLQSEKRFHDTYAVYQHMCTTWPHEQKVKQLEDLFHIGGRDIGKSL